MNKRFIFIFFVSLIFVVGSLLLSIAQTQERDSQTTYNSHWDNTCNNDSCVLNVYSYEKYFYDEFEEEWIEIDEGWSDCSTENETKLCTNEYYFRVEADDTGLVNSYLDSDTLGIKLTGFRNASLNFEPSFEDGYLIYEDVIPDYIDVRYQYLPRQLKEEIIVKQPLPSLAEDFDVIFARTGTADFNIAPSVICDSNSTCEYIDTLKQSDRVRVRIPVEFMNRENIVYPIIIDPTIEINDSDIVFEEDIEKVNNLTTTYVRGFHGSAKQHDLGTVLFGTVFSRLALDWNISEIPDSATINDVDLSLFINTVSSSVDLEVRHMEKKASEYADATGDCQGNCHFYNDLANGTIYNATTYTSDGFLDVLDLGDNALTDLENALSSDVFGTGVSVVDESDRMNVLDSTSINQSRRPRLIIAYTSIGEEPNDQTPPAISFINPTPEDDSSIVDTSIYVNVSSSDDSGKHYTFLDFNRDLRLWMRFDDTNSSGDPVDLSTWGNNGSLQGNTLINSSSGFWGNGSYFDGDDDYIQFIDDDSLDFDVEPFTYSAWIKTNVTGFQTIMDTDRIGALSPGYDIYINSADVNPRCRIDDGSSQPNVEATSSYVTDNDWHHVVCVRNSSGLNIFVDGAFQNSEATAGSLNVTTTNSLRIAQASNSLSYDYNGSIDDVLIFERELTSNEINTLYNALVVKYQNNFTDLSLTTHTFTAHSVDLAGNKNQTEDRQVTLIPPDTTAPSIDYVPPTPSNGSSVPDLNIKVSSSDDTGDHYVFTELNNGLAFWITNDDRNASDDPTDLSSNSNNVSLGGDASITNGYWGEGIDFDGDEDYGFVPYDDSLNLSDEWTIVLWAKPVEYDGMSFISKAIQGNHDYTVAMTSLGTLFMFHGGLNFTTSLTADINEWNFIAVTQNATDLIFYEDNNSEIENLIDLGNNNFNLTIGGRWGGTEVISDFNGTIDDVMIFHRSLNFDEIESLRNSTANQYDTTISDLADGSYTFKSYAIDKNGNRNETEERTIQVISDGEEGDSAIEIGINNSIPNNPIETDKQIYLLNENGEHYLGSFDKTTVKDHQTWSFNYVTSGESFTNIPSLFNVLNVWENQTLSFNEIVSQVETFINNTIMS